MKRILGITATLSALIIFLLSADTYKGFTLTKSVVIAERDCTVVEFEHKATGAQVVHIKNDDPENFFSICFRTYPKGANGVPHILEHCLMQSGSKKYPVQDMLMRMKSRSLPTFINALTTYEHTSYPASSQCEKDFYNLFDVYLQATFYPNLSRSIFHQEGHRFEFATYDDPATPLIYNGVVYNEMKGVFSLPERHLLRYILQELYPETTGPSFAGGDPKVITELTFEEFIQFYNDHYHPGNCTFFFYGNIPTEKHLDFLSENLLHSCRKGPSVPFPAQEPAFSAPKKSTYHYPSSEDDSRLVGISWLTSSSEEDSVALRLVDAILMASDASPLRHELMRSGLCAHVDSGFEPNMRQLPYLFIMSGCKEDNAEKIEEHLLATLEKIASEGIPKPVIERTFSMLELTELELKRGMGAPVGLSMLYSAGFAKLVGKEPEEALMLQTHINNLRKKLDATPGYLESLIRKYLLDNQHRVLLLLKPSHELAESQRQQEAEKLAAIKEQLTDEQVKEILAIAKQVRKTPEGDINLLPTITLDDVSQQLPHTELKSEQVGSLEVLHHPTFTNRISYAELEFCLPELTSDELWLAGLYSYLLPQLGTKERSYQEHLARIEEHTGGLTSSIVLRQNRPCLTIGGKALDRKAEILLDLIYEQLVQADFSDKEHLKVLLKKHVHEVDSALKSRAMQIASMASLAVSSEAMYLKNSFEGLDYARHVLELDKHLDETIEQLGLLQKKLIPAAAKLLLIQDEEAYTALRQKGFGRLSTFAEKEPQPWKMQQHPLSSTNFYYPIASQVAFNARGFITKTQNPYLLLASALVTDKLLYPRIRVEGGAYGARASYDPIRGSFVFSTYRDPHIGFSNQVFGEAVALLRDGNFADDDVVKAKISVLQKLDFPTHPAIKGQEAYSQLAEGMSHADLADFRRKIFTATAADIQQAACEHIVRPFEESVLVSFAPKALVDKEQIALEEY